MRTFFSFVLKECYHILRDRWTTIILLGMPIVEIILFGFALNTEVKNVKVAIFDPGGSEEVRRIAERLDANENLIVDTWFANEADADSYLRSGQGDLVVHFPADFSQSLYSADGASILLMANAIDANTATLFTNYAMQILTQEVARIRPPNPQMLAAMPDVRVKLLFNPGMKSAYNFVLGVMGMILMLLCAMMTSISIVREKEMGTMEVLLVSPVRPFVVILAKTVPYFLLSCINMATILLLSRYLLDVPVAGNLFTLVAVTMLFIMVSLSLGILISTLVKTQVAAMMMSGMVLMMPVMVFSGLIFSSREYAAYIAFIFRYYTGQVVYQVDSKDYD